MGVGARLHRPTLRVDPWAAGVGVVAFTVYVLHGFNAGLGRDIAMYTYGGQRFADGVPPYVDLLNRAGPLAHMLPGVGVLLARAGGFDEILGIRMLYLLISVAAVSVLYVLARDLFSSRLAGLVTSASFLTFTGFAHLATNGPRDKTPMVLFLLCSMLAMQRRRWLAVGVFVALATLTWQPSFLVGITVAVVGALTLPVGRWRALLLVAAGGLVPTAVVVAYFGLEQRFGTFLQAFLVINAEYTKAIGFLPHAAHNWRNLESGYHWSVWVFVTGLLALGLAAGMAVFARLSRARRRDTATLSLVSIGAGGVVGLVWTLLDFNAWPDAFVLLPFAALGAGAVARQATLRLPGQAALVLALAWIVAATTLAAGYAVTRRSDALEAQRASVQAVFSQLPADATVVSVEAPQVLVLTGKTSPIRIQTFGAGLARYVEETYPGGLRGLGRSIRRQHPTVIAVHGRVRGWLAPTLSAYAPVGRAPGWTWYVDRNLGSGVIDNLRQALGQPQQQQYG